MIHSFTSRGRKRYRYSLCSKGLKEGRRKCPAGSLPADEIKRHVVDQIRAVGRDPALRAEVLRQARAHIDHELTELRSERKSLERELIRHHAEIRKLVTNGPLTSVVTGRVADLHDRVNEAEQRATEIARTIAEIEQELPDAGALATAFANFDCVWNALSSSFADFSALGERFAMR
jgi:site-specific DNA recombinase